MTHFEREIREQAEVLRRIVHDDAPVRVGRALRDDAPGLVLTIARGSSGNAVAFFSYLLGRTLGVPVADLPPSLVTVQRAAIRPGDGLVVGVSQSGESQDVVEAFRTVATSGTRSLAISNAPGSSLEKAATWSLRQGAGEERAVAASKTFTSQMMLLSRLVAEWADDDGLREALARVPDVLDRLLNEPLEATHAAARLTHADQIDVLGRGLSQGPALELSLKLKETSYLHAHAYSSAEFQHGPIASLSAGDPVVLLALTDASLDANREAALRLAEMGADLTVISADPDLLALASAGVPLPGDLDPVTEAFAQVALGQWMALTLAGERGLDPDAPRNLRKVTQTR